MKALKSQEEGLGLMQRAMGKHLILVNIYWTSICAQGSEEADE